MKNTNSTNANTTILFLHFEILSRISTGKKQTYLYKELKNYAELKGINISLMGQRNKVLSSIEKEYINTPPKTLKHLCLTSFFDVINDANTDYSKKVIDCHKSAINCYDKRFLEDIKKTRYALGEVISLLHLQTVSALVQMNTDLFTPHQKVVRNYIQNVYKTYPQFKPVIEPLTLPKNKASSPQRLISSAQYINIPEAGLQ